MNTERKPVDVLAVIDRQVDCAEQDLLWLEGDIESGLVTNYEKQLADHKRAHKDAVEARAAVAELIEAASWYAYGGVRPAKEWAEANKRLRAALDGVKS